MHFNSIRLSNIPWHPYSHLNAGFKYYLLTCTRTIHRRNGTIVWSGCHFDTYSDPFNRTESTATMALDFFRLIPHLNMKPLLSRMHVHIGWCAICYPSRCDLRHVFASGDRATEKKNVYLARAAVVFPSQRTVLTNVRYQFSSLPE